MGVPTRHCPATPRRGVASPGESWNPGNPGMWIFSGGGRVFAGMLLLQLCCLSLSLARQSGFSRLSRQGKNSRLLTWQIPAKGPAAPISLFGRFGERGRSGGGRRNRQHAAILRSIELTNKEEEARENDRLLERQESGEEKDRNRRREEEIERRAKKKKEREEKEEQEEREE